MTHMITAAAMAELEERCMHEFFELALSNAMVENLCLTIAFLVEQKGKHFDPALVDLFIGQMPAIRGIRQRWAESEDELKAA